MDNVNRDRKNCQHNKNPHRLHHNYSIAHYSWRVQEGNSSRYYSSCKSMGKWTWREKGKCVSVIRFSFSSVSAIYHHWRVIYGASQMSFSPHSLSYISLLACSFDLLSVMLVTYTTLKKPDELSVRETQGGRARRKQQNDKHGERWVNRRQMLTQTYKRGDCNQHFFVYKQNKWAFCSFK